MKENNSLRERLSQLEQQPPVERQPNEAASLSSVSSHEDETIQMHNGFIQKIIVTSLAFSVLPCRTSRLVV